MEDHPIVSGKHSCDLLSVEITSQAHTLDEVVEAFECALRGVGYCFDGHFVLEEESDG